MSENNSPCSLDFIDLSTLSSVSLDELEQLPSIPGIYFAADSEKSVLYVGCSGNILERWENHDCAIELEQHQGVRIYWRQIDDVDALVSLEKALIGLLQPPLNRVVTTSRLGVFNDDGSDCLVSRLGLRYGIRKTAVYARLNQLGVVPTKKGKNSYVDEKQLALLDAFHEHILSHGSMSNFESDGFLPLESSTNLVSTEAAEEFLVSAKQKLERLKDYHAGACAIPSSQIPVIIQDAIRDIEFSILLAKNTQA